MKRWLAILFIANLSGCAALTNPVPDGIPASCVPDDWLAKPKERAELLPVTLLGQNKPAVYRLAPGDSLGVWIESVLSSPTQGPPIYTPPGRSESGPVLGYPIPVREDGTVSLPLVNPVSVTGMTVQEAEEAIRKAYTVTQPILQPGRERILVALQRRRTHHVIVYRDEQQNFNNPGSEASTVVLAATQKRGTGHSLDLPAGENDVLNALARSGGPPGLDAANEIIIEHRPRPADKDEPKVAPVIRIPLTHPSGAMPDIRPEDVILRDGDVVRIVDRDIERFYTGGLLPAGEFVLPRNYDLDVIQAMSFVKGPLVNGAFGPFGGAGISGTMIAPGLGGPSPSKLTILRRTPTGSQVAISVDLNAALHDPSERLLIKAGDVLILQETRCQAVARYAGMVFDKLTFNFSFQHNNQSGFNAAAFGGNLPGR